MASVRDCCSNNNWIWNHPVPFYTFITSVYTVWAAKLHITHWRCLFSLCHFAPTRNISLLWQAKVYMIELRYLRYWKRSMGFLIEQMLWLPHSAMLWGKEAESDIFMEILVVFVNPEYFRNRSLISEDWGVIPRLIFQQLMPFNWKSLQINSGW